MAVYVMEMRSTENWSDDVRYRKYTTSAAKADRFKERVPRIQFTDSGHGIVPIVRKHSGARKPEITLLRQHVEDALRPAPATATGRG